MASTSERFTPVSPGGLDELVAHAQAEQWQRLALIGPELQIRGYEDAFTGQIFRLSEPIDGTFFTKLAGLTSLRSLHLPGNQIGDEGARSLAVLTGLTSLGLAHNRIGAEGARALAALTGLTWLDLAHNRIGAEGGRALAALTGLTSLDLADNQIGDEGVRALAALTGLTSLNLEGNKIGAEGARSLAVLTGLTLLGLGDNRIGVEGARALAALTGLTSLGLAYNEIGVEGARAVAALTGLTSLGLAYNEIGVEGARAVAALTGLTWLDLAGNTIKDQGARALAALTSLTWLDLVDNRIRPEGAQALAALTSLASLDLAHNYLGVAGARALAALTGLTSLGLAHNRIRAEGARALAALTGLTSLDLADNQIGDEGVRALAALTGLTSLDLAGNQIGDEGARALAALSGLTSLSLGRNQIGDEGARALLDACAHRQPPSWIRRLDLTDNGDLSSILPAEVLATADAQAILAAYRRFAAEREELKPLDEAKLLVVGNEAVGKTSLIRYLVEGKPRDPSEQKTRGTEIHEKIETQTWSPDQSQVTLNVWDFGGQEMMRGTHRFFLTARSLYLLVLENRFEDDVQKVHEWLKTVRNRGGESPVIVVISKCDRDRPYVRKDDEEGLRHTYPNIVGFLRAACNDDDESRASIAALRRLIVDTIVNDERLEHVHRPLLPSWLRVKGMVSTLAEKHSILHSGEFQAICLGGQEETDRITDPDEQRALLRLLHDLGTVVAHGLERDAPAARREITLLDPNWLTRAIYAVLEKAGSVEQDGEFSRAQLSEWLDRTAYPPERHEFILDMIQDPDIGLAARLPGSKDDRYLVPRALPAKSPFYGNWPASSIRLRYRYDLLPSGLFPRFVVEAHRDLADPPTRWQTGAVLEVEGCPVLVSADLGDRRIEIAVDGRAGRGRMALGTVRNHLKAVHERNPEVKPDERVPLKDQQEIDVSFTHLLRLEELEGADFEFLPEGAQRKYAVSELLEGVRPERVPLEPHRSEGPMAYHVSARDKAAVTIVGGDVSSSSGATVKLGTERTVAVLAPMPTAERPKGASWHWLALGCGAASILLAAVLWPLPWSGWRVAVASIIGIGAAVTLLVLSLNPARYYRWCLSALLPVGPLHAAGVSIEAGGTSEFATGFLRWDGETSTAFLVVWGVIVIALIIADLVQQRAIDVGTDRSVSLTTSRPS